MEAIEAGRKNQCQYGTPSKTRHTLNHIPNASITGDYFIYKNENYIFEKKKKVLTSIKPFLLKLSLAS